MSSYFCANYLYGNYINGNYFVLRNFQFVQNGKDSNIHELNNATGPSVQAYEYGRNMIAKYNCKKIRLIQMIVDAVRSCF